MHDDRLLVEQRLERVLRERLRPAVHAVSVPFDAAARHGRPAADCHVREPALASDEPKQEVAPASIGDTWGAPRSKTWLRLAGVVPLAWTGRELEAVVDLGFWDEVPGFQAEALVYGPDRVPIKAVSP